MCEWLVFSQSFLSQLRFLVRSSLFVIKEAVIILIRIGLKLVTVRKSIRLKTLKC
ncbi:hypothetical protein VCRA2119O147_930008 [Vibrio crassostreae]|uniref:Uncharacterized protein n=1 Tax=Vibrio crassostreae TaxID=246167 RepID=A0A822MPH9_9VIBR|nr:hypothetical protein VCRA2110O135_10178 [Vibrio crassostreae]CAK1849097.1 hypothetical protein VCRA2110O175_10205 [Vibrio crassostreae]CAK1852124.1 hypothetical protein VCRA2113O221_10199 [Vibrio crassostreae]CAK1855293.1 hypothetical protein VCRA2113O231_10194 [Vibrio crassostreae]CAK1856162.1 hypothetical protein VCRA2110O173_10323 [Vibrio crassostreae]